VLVADDDDDIRMLMRLRLTRRGYDVSEASDGLVALAKIRSAVPDAAVLDWVMPGLTGPDLCETLRADPATAGMGLVLLTARATDADIAAGRAAGADEYLTKPFEIEALDAALQRALARPR
jgi:two-component system, OmpR family, phosphate regulon response regulator PhoB